MTTISIYSILSFPNVFKKWCIGVQRQYTPIASKNVNLGNIGINCVRYDIANPITQVTIITFNVIFNFSINLIYEKLFNTPNKKGEINSSF